MALVAPNPGPDPGPRDRAPGRNCELPSPPPRTPKPDCPHRASGDKWRDVSVQPVAVRVLPHTGLHDQRPPGGERYAERSSTVRSSNAVPKIVLGHTENGRDPVY